MDLEILLNLTGSWSGYSKFLILRYYLKFQNMLTLCSRNTDWMKKKYYQQNSFIINFAIVSANLIHANWCINYKDKEFWNICTFDFMYQFISESMINIKNISSTILSYFRLYVCTSNFVGIDSLGENLRIYVIFLLIFMTPT